MDNFTDEFKGKDIRWLRRVTFTDFIALHYG
jgi:hypothetical protein